MRYRVEVTIEVDIPPYRPFSQMDEADGLRGVIEHMLGETIRQESPPSVVWTEPVVTVKAVSS